MRIYLDNCCFNRPYDSQEQLQVAMETQSKLHIQSRVKNGELELVDSYILNYENSCNPFEMRRQAIAEFLQKYAAFYVGPERDGAITDKALEIMKNGIKEKDAFHVSAAIYSKCDYFITTDRRLLKYKTKEVKIVSPIEFIVETEDE